jgi:hypothetical protein
MEENKKIMSIQSESYDEKILCKVYDLFSMIELTADVSKSCNRTKNSISIFKDLKQPDKDLYTAFVIFPTSDLNLDERLSIKDENYYLENYTNVKDKENKDKNGIKIMKNLTLQQVRLFSILFLFRHSATVNHSLYSNYDGLITMCGMTLDDIPRVSVFIQGGILTELEYKALSELQSLRPELLSDDKKAQIYHLPCSQLISALNGDKKFSFYDEDKQKVSIEALQTVEDYLCGLQRQKQSYTPYNQDSPKVKRHWFDIFIKHNEE